MTSVGPVIAEEQRWLNPQALGQNAKEKRMETFETIRAVLAWSSLLNLGMLTFAAIVMMVAGDAIKGIHSRLYGLSDTDLDRAYFQYMANYKIMIFVFNLAPYLAMRIVG